MGLKLERARAGGGQSRELPALNRGCRPLSWPPAALVTGIQRESPGSNSNPTIPGGHVGTPLPGPKCQGYLSPRLLRTGESQAHSVEEGVEGGRPADGEEEEEVSRWWPSQLCFPDSPPATTLLPGRQMLLFLTLWALVPCLVLLTLYFLSSTGGKSGGNKKNDGVKVSPREPAGLSLPETCGSGLGQAPGLAHGGGRPVGSRAKLLSPDHPVCAPPALTSHRVSWEQIGQWQVAWVAWSPVKGQILRRRLGFSGAVTRGYQRAGNGH